MKWNNLQSIFFLFTEYSEQFSPVFKFPEKRLPISPVDVHPYPNRVETIVHSPLRSQSHAQFQTLEVPIELDNGSVKSHPGWTIA